MPSSLKIKKKPQTLNKATSDSQLPKTLTSTQKLLFSNRADLEHSDQGRDLLQTMRSPHKASHFLNLQIPSLNPSALPSSKTMIKSKLVSSKTLKSPRATSLKKKKQAEPESFKTPTEDQEQHKSDKMILEDMNEEARVLEKELQKALDENKRLKSKMQVVRVSDEQIDDLMKNFKNRLQKVLFEAAKAEKEAEFLQNEKNRVKKEQKIYKKQLDSMIFVKQIQKEDEIAQKEKEGEEVVRYVKNLKVVEKERKMQELERQKQLSNVLDSHKNLHLLNKEQDKIRTWKEDQRYLNYMQAKLDQELQKQREKKEAILKQQQEIRKMVEIQKDLKIQSKIQEQALEARLLEDQRKQDEKREKEHKDYLQMMNIKQQQKVHNFQSFLSKTHEKDQLVSQWISNGIKEAEQKRLLDDQLSSQKRIETKIAAQNSMKKVLEQKEIENLKTLNEKKKEFEENFRRNQEMKHSETVSKLLELERKKNYRDQLNLQNLEAKSHRSSPYVLSRNEQIMNKDLFSEKRTALQIQGGTIVASPGRNALNGKFPLDGRSYGSPVYRGPSQIFF